MSPARKRKLRLLADDPHCYWCGDKVVDCISKNSLPTNAATLDHLRPNCDPERVGAEIGYTVLACRQCNGGRGCEFVGHPTLEERRANARRWKKRHRALTDGLSKHERIRRWLITMGLQPEVIDGARRDEPEALRICGEVASRISLLSTTEEWDEKLIAFGLEPDDISVEIAAKELSAKRFGEAA